VPNKEHICLLFCFHQKKSATRKKSAAHRIIILTYGKNVIVIRMCVNWFKRFKNSDFDNNIINKGCPATVEEDKLQKDGKKWKILQLIYIIDFFIIITKNCKKLARTFA